MKKTLCILLAIVTTLSTGSFAAPTMVGTATTAKENTVIASENENATTMNEQANFAPGINILTGTENALNFNNMQDVSVDDGSLEDAEGNLILTYDKSATKTLSVVDSPVSSADGKVIKLSDYVLNNATPYPKVYFKNYEMPEDGRPVLITYKALVLNADNCTGVGKDNVWNVNSNWAMFSDKTNNNVGLKSYSSKAASYEWKWSVHAYDKAKTSETKYSEPAYIQVYAPVANGTGFTEGDLQPNHYFDDISMTPYYKVTYMNGDTMLGEAWVLDDGYGNILKSFDPAYHFDGEYPEGTNAWSLTKGGRAAHSVELNNEDIVVYAVYAANFTPGINILTDTEQALNFDSDSYSISGTNVVFNGKTIFKLSEGSGEIVTSPVTGESTNKALKWNLSVAAGKAIYPQVNGFEGKLPEDGRPIFVGVHTLVANGDNIKNDKWNSAIRVGADNGISTWVNKEYTHINLYTSAQTPSEWLRYGTMDNVSTTALPVFLYTLGAPNGDAEPDVYMDNIHLTPYYKVTYMNGDTVLDEAWVLDDGYGNILKSFDPANHFDGEYPEGTNAWSLTKNGRAARSIELNNKDIVVYAVYAANFTPGINILTDTEQALNFDSDSYSISGTNVVFNGKTIFKLSMGSGEIVTSPVTGESTNKALKWNGISLEASKQKYPTAQNFAGALPEDKRPIFVGIHSLVANGDNLKNSKYGSGIRVYANGAQLESYTYINLYTSTQKPSEWTHYGIKDEKSTTELPKFLYNFETSANGAAQPVLYIDNIYMTPYYKVTYMNGDTQIGEVWVLDDGNGNILHSFNPAEQGVELPEGKSFWSLTDGGEAVTQVALEYKDIVLYAGYDEEIQDELCPESYFTSSIRTANPSGIRFRASVTTEQKTQAEEYGFIVTLEKHLGTTEAESLTMESNITKLTGVSYGIDPTTGSSVDKIFEKTNENIFFTAALYGMPDTEDAYRQKIIVRPYLKDKDGNYHYAQPIIRSVLDVATAIRDGGYTVVDEDGRKYVENILTVCKESQN